MEKVNLVEYIYPKMDILFVALNAPEKSNKNKHWFSGNLSFWNLLFKSGLITEQITKPACGDIKVFGSTGINFRHQFYGVTDLHNQLVQTNSSKVKTTDEQVKRILSILDKNEVNKVCL